MDRSELLSLTCIELSHQYQQCSNQPLSTILINILFLLLLLCLILPPCSFLLEKPALLSSEVCCQSARCQCHLTERRAPVSPLKGKSHFLRRSTISGWPPASKPSSPLSVPRPTRPLSIGSMPTPETSEECVVCSSSQSTVSCRQCSRLLYCSASCQMKDSGSSLHTCLPYSVLYEPRCGRLLIAARDISAGEVVPNQSRSK